MEQVLTTEQKSAALKGWKIGSYDAWKVLSPMTGSEEALDELQLLSLLSLALVTIIISIIIVRGGKVR